MNVTELRNEIRIRNNNMARIIENGTDDDGVLTDEAFEILLKADENTDVLRLGVFEGINGYKTLADAVKGKMDRLKNLEKYYRNTETSLRKLMLKLVEEGENYNTEDFSISWRKSSYLDIDEFASMKEIGSKFPDAIKIEKTFRKDVLKKIIKDGEEIDGVQLKNRNNLVIK